MTSRPVVAVTASKNDRTLVLICRRDFCRILDRVLLVQGFTGVEHGDLSLVGKTDIESRVGRGGTEAYVIRTDAQQAESLINHLRACPISARNQEPFTLYTVGD